MEYLSKEEVIKLIWYFFETRSEVKKSTKFLCVLYYGGPSEGRGLTVCTNRTIPRGTRRIIVGFDAEYSDEQPDLELIRQKVEQNWDELSEIKRSDYDNLLERIQEEQA